MSMLPSRGSEPLKDINVTPLLDVLLILLVIVMLTSTLFVKSLNVTLPQTSLDAPPTVVRSLSISVTSKGAVLVNDTPMSLEQAAQKVQAGTTVLVYADQAASYASVAKVLSALQQRNPAAISLMVR
jgi:biopolymer transport protein ExbD